MNVHLFRFGKYTNNTTVYRWRRRLQIRWARIPTEGRGFLRAV
jgi:hypothetical protein